ncbi:MAG: hypothetical protein IIV03_01915 [Clostridia bacterium]|nr:hypothetical protein [Clostridia bacterium]
MLRLPVPVGAAKLDREDLFLIIAIGDIVLLAVGEDDGAGADGAVAAAEHQPGGLALALAADAVAGRADIFDIFADGNANLSGGILEEHFHGSGDVAVAVLIHHALDIHIGNDGIRGGNGHAAECRDQNAENETDEPFHANTSVS